MKKYLLAIALAACVLPACSQMKMGDAGAKSEATGSAGGANAANANASLERCGSPFGTLAVNEDQTANWYSWLGRYGIQHHHLFLDFYNCYLELLTLSVTHSYWHSNFNFHILRKSIFRHFDHHFRIAGTIRFIKRNINGLLLSYGHSGNTLVKTGNNASTAYFKFKRFTTG